jgi:hypothetical protein
LNRSLGSASKLDTLLILLLFVVVLIVFILQVLLSLVDRLVRVERGLLAIVVLLVLIVLRRRRAAAPHIRSRHEHIAALLPVDVGRVVDRLASWVVVGRPIVVLWGVPARGGAAPTALEAAHQLVELWGPTGIRGSLAGMCAPGVLALVLAPGRLFEAGVRAVKVV